MSTTWIWLFSSCPGCLNPLLMDRKLGVSQNQSGYFRKDTHLFPAGNWTMIPQPYEWFMLAISCYQTQWCSSKTLVSHLGDAWFEYWLSHWLSRLRPSLSFLSPSWKMPGKHSPISVPRAVELVHNTSDSDFDSSTFKTPTPTLS
jgi:hypothetical protein